MNKEKLLELYNNHKYEIIGSIIGALFGIFVIIIGFWKAIFIGICTFAGYFIGRKLSNKEELVEFLDRVLPPGR
jgi:uncharacterized membrane protein